MMLRKQTHKQQMKTKNIQLTHIRLYLFFSVTFKSNPKIRFHIHQSKFVFVRHVVYLVVTREIGLVFWGSALFLLLFLFILGLADIDIDTYSFIISLFLLLLVA